MKRKTPLILALLAALLSGSCGRSTPTQSDVYSFMFPDKGYTFRKVKLGMTMQEVKVAELPVKPEAYSDEITLSYRYTLPDHKQILTDFYSARLKSSLNSDILLSLVAHVYFEDEVEAAQIYNEFQQRFTEQYGLPNGSYGSLVWNGGTEYAGNMEIRLFLNDNKKGFSVNYLSTEVSLKKQTP